MTPESTGREGLLPIGTLLAGGKYRIEQYLSSGGFGNTYVATDTAFDEKVAIKELFIRGVCGRSAEACDITVSLTENLRTFEAQRDKFRKEARRLRKFNNPNIVKVHNLFDENGTSYYVMDFVEGENLSVRTKRRRRPMTESELLALLPQVLDALETVHAEGMWHLDLKPANIMVDRQGNVQLIDFGASKQLRNADGQSLSTSSALAYTPGYASSEQMEQNLEKFGPWTDLYSLGATMFNLLTCKQPPSPSDIDEDPDEALRLPDGVGRKTRELVMWLMKPNRKMRPQSVADVRAYLGEADETESGAGKPEERLRSVSSEDGSTRLKEPTYPIGEVPDVDTPSPKPKKTRHYLAVVLGVVALVAAGYYIYWSPVVQETINSFLYRPKYVEEELVTITDAPENMREYHYTGNLENTASGWLPEGEGTARFKEYGNVPAATYTGRFENGICHDESGCAKLEFSSGDKYVGTFVRGYYGEGTYTKADGSYFKGTFEEGAPKDGTWYNADGSYSADVVNGNEQDSTGRMI